MRKFTYHLQLTLLLRLLESHEQTCTLWAEIPAGQQMACQAELVVVQGNVHSCLLRSQRTGQVLQEGRRALEQLAQRGQLQWHVQPDVSSSAAAHTALLIPSEGGSWGQRPPPHHVDPLTRSQIELLARKHRQVLLLADGQRDMETLARMTHCTPEQLHAILDDLAAQHLIRPAPAHERLPT